jgi:hypothetical protein
LAMPVSPGCSTPSTFVQSTTAIGDAAIFMRTV